MNIKDVIRAEKNNLELGKWADGHIPRSAFPMSRLKDKRYKYGPDYSWRVVKFEIGDLECRILVMVNESKQIFRARLGVNVNVDMAVLCDHEFHASEPGWHCHLSLAPLASIAGGAARHDKSKWPRNSSRQDFGSGKAGAITLVAALFNFMTQGDLI